MKATADNVSFDCDDSRSILTRKNTEFQDNQKRIMRELFLTFCKEEKRGCMSLRYEQQRKSCAPSPKCS